MNSSLKIPFLILGMLAIGCASQKVQVIVDVYQGEIPHDIKETTVINALQKFSEINVEANQVASQKIALAEGLYEAYESYLRIHSEIYSTTFEPSNMSILNSYLVNYKDTIEGLVENVQNRVRVARASLKQENINNISELQLYAETEMINDAFLDLINYQSSDLNNVLFNFWPDLLNDLRRISDDQNLIDNNKIQSQVQALILQFSRLSKLIEKQNSNINIDEIDPSTLETPNAYRESINALYTIFSEIPKDVSYQNREKALADFTRQNSILFSQIERLQDPADPAWKFLKNEKKNWNTEFNKTYFKAIGDNSIVLVRDTPSSFRVQQANNDPSVVIENQLQISRAVSGAAISIAGAFIGVDPPIGQQSPTDDESIYSVSLKTKIEEQNKIRSRNLAALSASLEILKDELNQLDPADDTKKEELIKELKALMTAYYTYFKKS